MAVTIDFFERTMSWSFKSSTSGETVMDKILSFLTYRKSTEDAWLIFDQSLLVHLF